jgi:hypothetical protein
MGALVFRMIFEFDGYWLLRSGPLLVPFLVRHPNNFSRLFARTLQVSSGRCMAFKLALFFFALMRCSQFAIPYQCLRVPLADASARRFLASVLMFVLRPGCL